MKSQKPYVWKAKAESLCNIMKDKCFSFGRNVSQRGSCSLRIPCKVNEQLQAMESINKYWCCNVLLACDV